MPTACEPGRRPPPQRLVPHVEHLVLDPPVRVDDLQQAPGVRLVARQRRDPLADLGAGPARAGGPVARRARAGELEALRDAREIQVLLVHLRRAHQRAG